MELKDFIDYTLLRADATTGQVLELCREAAERQVKAVCINPSFLDAAREALKNSGVILCTVIGFPLGASTKEAKIAEAEQALAKGARELDMVIHIGALKEGRDAYVMDEVQSIARLTHQADARLKVIIETSLLTEEEKERVCQLLLETGADFVKTSTGFSTGGATVADIRLIKSIVGEKMEIKASGGIKTQEFALALIDAGATRIGASSIKDILNG